MTFFIMAFPGGLAPEPIPGRRNPSRRRQLFRRKDLLSGEKMGEFCTLPATPLLEEGHDLRECTMVGLLAV